jgi:hypothetical protein
MKGIFEFIIDGKLRTFHDYKDIPENFEHVIKFMPDIPEGPHSHDQHEEIDQWNERLQHLIEIEKRNVGKHISSRTT